MNVAEDANDAWAIETDSFRSADGVAAKIEGLRFRKRKHVVIGVIVVRKVDGRTRDDSQHVRLERFVALIHPRARLVGPFERGARGRVEIHDAAPIRRFVICPHSEVRDADAGSVFRRRLAEFDAAADDSGDAPRRRRGKRLRINADDRQGNQSRHENREESSGHQNQYTS